MPQSVPHRTRAQRVAASVKYVGFLARSRDLFLLDHGLLKVGLILLSSLILTLLVRAWDPPFGYRFLARTDRDITCCVPFMVNSSDKTEEARRNARLESLHIYVHDTTKLSQFKAGLVNAVGALLSAENYTSMKDEQKAKWRSFLPPNTPESDLSTAFDRFQKAFESDAELAHFKQTVDLVFAPYEKNGLLIQLHGFREGNQERIYVYDSVETEENQREVPVTDVMIGNAYMIKDRLNQRYDWNIAELLFQWIRPMIPETLSENKEATLHAKEAAASRVETVYTKYEPGQVIVRGGKPIDFVSFELLKSEYRNILQSRTPLQKMVRAIGCFMLIFVILFLSYFFVVERLKWARYPKNLIPFTLIYTLVILTVVIGRLLQILLDNQGANPELIPLLIFAQIVTIVFTWEIAIFTGFVATFVLALSSQFDLGEFLIIIGTLSIIVVLSRDIRTRGRIIFIAMLGGFTAFLTSYCMGLLRHQMITDELFFESALRMIWTFLAGFLFAGLLPMMERVFGIMTPMRLLEIGNPSHPLLQELARRAPASYNHSIQTAAIAEAAAEAIGARGALVRVGGYFHDIGKMLKPLYFTENQPLGSENIHHSLEPRVSTLLIVAHVKEGVDLARQYHLPQPVIDLVEQHHGTMLVSFFHAQANKTSLEGVYGQEIDESPFRYPGPVPQSREAGILMLADAAESACRSFGDDVPPGRIENAVRNISESRMKDGQFDHSGLTLGEIRTIENSIITSILACRHSRIKYPGKEPKPSEPHSLSSSPSTAERTHHVRKEESSRRNQICRPQSSGPASG